MNNLKVLIGKTTNERRSAAAKALQEEALHEEILSLHKDKEKKDSLQESLGKGMKRRKSSVEFGKKKAFIEKVSKAYQTYMTHSIIKEALSVDLSHISDEEFKEQVSLVEHTTFCDIIDPTLLGKDLKAIRDPNHSPNLSVYIGLSTPQKPDSLVKKLSVAIANTYASCADNPAETKGTVAVANFLDTKELHDLPYKGNNTLLGGGLLSKEGEQRLSECNDVMTALITSVAAKVKQNVLEKLVEDKKRREFEDDQYTGLSESTVSLRKRKAKKFTNSSILEELFKNTSTLQESVGAKQEDYLLEAVFHYTILEAYKVLGCVTKSDDDIIVSLQRQRNKILRG